MLNTDQIKAFAKLYLARKKLRDKDKELTEKITSMEKSLVEHMLVEEFDKVSLKGGITVSIDPKIWAKVLVKDEYGDPDRNAVVEALRKAGLDEYITSENFNQQSLSAYLRELDQAGEKLPPELEDIIAPNEVSKLKVKKLK